MTPMAKDPRCSSRGKRRRAVHPKGEGGMLSTPRAKEIRHPHRGQMSRACCRSETKGLRRPPRGQRSRDVVREGERGEPATARQRIYAGSREAKEARRPSRGQRPIRRSSSVPGRKLNCEREERREVSALTRTKQKQEKKQVKHIPRLHLLCRDFIFGCPDLGIMIQHMWMVTCQHWMARDACNVGRMARCQ